MLPFTLVTPVRTLLSHLVAIGGILPEQVLFVNGKLLVYSIFTSKYSTELFVWPIETKWPGSVLCFIVMLSSTFELPQLVANRGGILPTDSHWNFVGNSCSKVFACAIRG